MVLVTLRARVYFNWGRWVADCPQPGCAGAEHVGTNESGFEGGLTDTVFFCHYCRLICEADWPAEREAIERVLARRPVPSNRNWFPDGHDLAIRGGVAHGQTVRDLQDENEEHGVERGAVA